MTKSATGTTSIPDNQPLSRSLNVPVRNQDTIHEGVDGPGSDARESLWMGNGGEARGRRRRRTSSGMRMAMWVITEDNRLRTYTIISPTVCYVHIHYVYACIIVCICSPLSM